MTPEEVLSNAAKLVEQGWIQWRSTRERENGTDYCMGQALTQGCKGMYAALDLANKAVLRELGKSGLSSLAPIITFNDTPGRTVEEVAATLRNAKRWL